MILTTVAGLCAGIVSLSPTTAGGQAAACEQPYAPVAFAESYPAQEELPEVDAEPVPMALVASPLTFDSDGDGTDDTVERGPDGVTITRGDGEVVLTDDGPANATGLGDIDGDGRDELQVQTSGDVFLVPGTVPTGTTPVADAGIRLPFGAAGAVHLADGSDRLLVLRPEGNSLPDEITDVLDGSDALDLGPGGDAGTLDPALTLLGQVRFTADLGDGPMVLVAGRSVADGTGNRVELSIVEGAEVIALTTLPERFQAEYVSEYGSVEILVGPDGTFVTLVQASRNGSASYMWSLDDPCTALDRGDSTPPPAPPGTAPAAEPVAAEAAFTG